MQYVIISYTRGIRFHFLKVPIDTNGLSENIILLFIGTKYLPQFFLSFFICYFFSFSFSFFFFLMKSVRVRTNRDVRND